MKHRIVGSLMLLSLAVIILPFWFDGAGLEEYQSDQQQPAMPVAPQLSASTPPSNLNAANNVAANDLNLLELSPVLVTENLSTNGQDKAQAANKVQPKAKHSGLNSQGLPNGWVVQLGSFGERTNATRLKNKVIKAGFAAYMLPDGKLFKVLVGPELNRLKAEALQKQLKNKFKMTGMVTLYEVEKL